MDGRHGLGIALHFLLLSLGQERAKPSLLTNPRGMPQFPGTVGQAPWGQRIHGGDPPCYDGPEQSQSGCRQCSRCEIPLLAQLYKEELAIAVATEGDTSCGSFLAAS